MTAFVTYGNLKEHDIGVIFNDDDEYVGTAILCKSSRHPNISINVKDFKFASKCFEYAYCENSRGEIQLITMDLMITLFKENQHMKSTEEYKVFDWATIEDPTAKQRQIPF